MWSTGYRGAATTTKPRMTRLGFDHIRWHRPRRWRRKRRWKWRRSITNVGQICYAWCGVRMWTNTSRAPLILPLLTPSLASTFYLLSVSFFLFFSFLFFSYFFLFFLFFCFCLYFFFFSRHCFSSFFHTISFNFSLSVFPPFWPLSNQPPPVTPWPTFLASNAEFRYWVSLFTKAREYFQVHSDRILAKILILVFDAMKTFQRNSDTLVKYVRFFSAFLQIHSEHVDSVTFQFLSFCFSNFFVLFLSVFSFFYLFVLFVSGFVS